MKKRFFDEIVEKKEAERLHRVVKITIMIFERGKEHEKYA